MEIKSTPVGLRITPSLYAAIEKAAHDDGRSIADYVARAVAEKLRREGYLTTGG
jgi:hypothetical protein